LKNGSQGTKLTWPESTFNSVFKDLSSRRGEMGKGKTALRAVGAGLKRGKLSKKL